MHIDPEEFEQWQCVINPFVVDFYGVDDECFFTRSKWSILNQVHLAYSNSTFQHYNAYAQNK